MAGLAQRWYSARIGEGLIYDLRTQVFGHVQRQPIAFFTRAQTGSLVARLNSDVIGAQQAITSTLSSVVANIVSLVAILVAMFLSWLISIIALALVPLFLLPARQVGRRCSPSPGSRCSRTRRSARPMTERFNVAGAMLVKLFGRPRTEDDVFARRAARVRDIGVRTAMNNRVFIISLTLMAAMATAVVYGLGGWLMIRSVIQLGTLVALAALLGRVYGPITSLSNVRIDIMTALVSFERVFEVLDLEPLSWTSPTPGRAADERPAMELDDVPFRYPRATRCRWRRWSRWRAAGAGRPARNVLDGVTFAAAPAGLIALVGPSGAGKTTITSLVARLYDAGSGAVRINGIDLRDVTLESLHDAVGVVTQDAHLFHDTLRANLRTRGPTPPRPS